MPIRFFCKPFIIIMLMNSLQKVNSFDEPYVNPLN